MKMKLTYIQFMALYDMHKTFAISNMPDKLEDKLLHLLMLGIYQKFYTKAVEKKKKYQISLSVQEAIMFFLYWNKHTHHPTSFEGNLLTTLCNSIHQKFS